MNISSTSNLAVYYDGNAARRIEPRGVPARETPVVKPVGRESRSDTAPVEQIIEGEVLNKPREAAHANDEISGREFLQRRRFNEQLQNEYGAGVSEALRQYQETAQLNIARASQIDVFV
ncbi:MAG: hypothetical protein HY272_06475 [Gammaproteobacteria bacterium]|nr:hypothetical protein [Gammaproteobacteria bacterium]